MKKSTPLIFIANSLKNYDAFIELRTTTYGSEDVKESVERIIVTRKLELMGIENGMKKTKYITP